MQCEIYKCSKKDQTYLYVEKPFNSEHMPVGLLNVLGELEFVMDLELRENTKLASENAAEVIKNISDNAYFLQMPPDIVNRVSVQKDQ